MENSPFQGSFISWAFGLPIVVLIIITKSDPRIYYLIMHASKMVTGNELIIQLKILRELVDTHSYI